ncbi:sulfotransferase [Halomonas sp. BC04]|uniref:sulfotransferase n=1 Tax=Halomonas sp. BC04 TaxID=1403540 RepID=UPI0003ED76C6|nr:sulfotransferase [Halomonas sp. BC04]EWH00825.1 hypothetical protein Q427_17375 [Halomonas sp. BC04]
MAFQGRIHQKREHFEAAIGVYGEALAMAPGMLGAKINLAACLNRCARRDEALELIDQVLQAEPLRASALIVKGDIHRERHEIEAALACYRQAQVLEPHNATLYQTMAHLERFTADSPAFAALAKRLTENGLTPQDRAGVHYTLGKAYLDIGDDAQAFAHYEQANAIMDESLPPIRAELERNLTFTRRHFTPSLFETLAPHGVQARPQIIVAGMSRAGKSLVESLFRGVKGVSLAGEDLVLGEYATELLEPLEGKLPAYLAQLDPDRLSQDAEGYLKRLDPGDNIKVTTVPGDLWFLGLIGLWMPKVPIIFCVRNLLDLGVTGYFHQYQIPKGYRYSFDQHQMGRQIACSEKVMDHWAQVLPNPVYLVDYEALTRDSHTVMNNLLGELGLEREQDYEEIVGRNAALLDSISPIVSTDAPMPVTDRFNGIGERFRDRLSPMIEGYKTIADAFPRMDVPATFPQPLPDALVASDEEARPSEGVSFDWQLPERVVVVDNGAKLTNSTNLEKLMAFEAFSLIAFDPFGEVTLEEPWRGHPHLQHFPRALLGDGQPGTLYACLDPALSSTLAPLPAERLPERQRQGAQVLAKLPFQSVALDAIEGLPGIDWLVLDDRHDSLAVLEHGSNALSNTLLIQVQVRFQPTHEGQPSLDALSHWAARHGMRFYRLLGFEYAQCMPPRDDLISRPEATELAQAGALLIPDAARLAALSDTQRLKLAFLLDSVYQIHDLTYELLSQVGHELGERYLMAKAFSIVSDRGRPVPSWQRCGVNWLREGWMVRQVALPTGASSFPAPHRCARCGPSWPRGRGGTMWPWPISTGRWIRHRKNSPCA